MLIFRLLMAIALSAIFIAYSWAHLQSVPRAAVYIAFAVLGGANLGLAIAAAIIHFTWRDKS